MSSEVYLYLGLIGIFFLIISFAQWRFSIYFFFVWLLLEGAFRKWFLPGLEKPLFFVKYFILLGPFVKCFLFSRNIKFPGFMVIIYMYVLWGLAECANFSATTDPRVFVIGLLIHFCFISLIFIVPVIFDSREKVIRFFRISVLFSLPILLLGIIQYGLPHTHFLNKYAEESSNIVAVGGIVRITGSFSYIAGYSSFLKFIFFVIVLLIVVEKNKAFTMINFISFGLVILNGLFTGSRSVIAIFAVGLLLFIFCSIFIRDKTIFVFFQRLFFVGFILIIVLLTTEKGQNSVDLVWHRFTKNSEETQSRVLDNLYLPELQNAGIMGYGIGTTYQGNQQFVNLHLLGLSYESEKSRLILELGLGGYTLVMLLRIIILFWGWKIFFLARKEYKVFIAMALIHIHLGLLGAVFNFLEGIFYWFSVGLVIAINNLDKKQQQHKKMVVYHIKNNKS